MEDIENKTPAKRGRKPKAVVEETVVEPVSEEAVIENVVTEEPVVEEVKVSPVTESADVLPEVIEEPRVSPVRKYTVYYVRRGDTLMGIATRFHMNYRQIAIDNGIDNPYKIYTGQALKIYQ